MISRVCEEFGCLPSEAVRELEEADADLVFTVLEMRSYARAKQVVDSAKKQSDLKQTAPIRRVFQVEAEALRTRRKG